MHCFKKLLTDKTVCELSWRRRRRKLGGLGEEEDGPSNYEVTHKLIYKLSCILHVMVRVIWSFWKNTTVIYPTTLLKFSDGLAELDFSDTWSYLIGLKL